MQATIGGFSRNTPRIRVRAGWTGDAKANFCESLPPASGQTITSGQLIMKSVIAGVPTYSLATRTGLDLGNTPAFAFFDTTDPTTTASGLLLGLSCTGKFVIETAFYDAGSYAPGLPLMVSGTTAGNVAAQTSGSGYPVVGFAQGLVSYLSTYPNLEENSETDGSGSAWVSGGGYVLKLDTSYQPVIT
jgi:hypothetical protein